MSKKSRKNKKLYNKIASEVDTILNQSPNSCYYFFNEDNNYSVNGSDDILKIFDFTYLIPNLFRKCYTNNTLKIPNICPSIIENSVINLYLPILIDEKYMGTVGNTNILIQNKLTAITNNQCILRHQFIYSIYEYTSYNKYNK